MTTKLTLTIEENVIELAKKYAASNGRSLSDLVENYLKSLPVKNKAPKKAFSQKISKLKGIISVQEDFDYRKVLANELAKKHLGK